MGTNGWNGTGIFGRSYKKTVEEIIEYYSTDHLHNPFLYMKNQCDCEGASYYRHLNNQTPVIPIDVEFKSELEKDNSTEIFKFLPYHIEPKPITAIFSLMISVYKYTAEIKIDLKSAVVKKNDTFY
jgi:hypothetical protein